MIPRAVSLVILTWRSQSRSPTFSRGTLHPRVKYCLMMLEVRFSCKMPSASSLDVEKMAARSCKSSRRLVIYYDEELA